ncbi:GntR family transcriptional regulator [Zhihengliuella halotolerans]|uniref:GntR family transcriptional regulator n=1 Tax=Zhihengliuella halotolerans TaxID=370736 RepID=A0A4Q8AD26_9MICC|nr:GntR family transcriptional regulator [Zhihengliuella halotolerans]RZU62127.1 GntR family transcriptional regulator [Zhihengliuella halotolerans]
MYSPGDFPWAQPVQATPGVPLRVAAYSRISEAIRDGQLAPGALLPTESELGQLMSVSRTVVREALMLLEEDGLVRARRGVGRFVSPSLPRIGIERVHPYEDVFSHEGRPAELVSQTIAHQPASDFVSQRIGLANGAASILFESVLARAGEPVAHLQEHVALSSVEGPEAIIAATTETESESTLLARLIRALGPGFGRGTCEISAAPVGATRAEPLALAADDPVLVLTQTVARGNAGFYLSKCVVPARAGHLTLKQT